MIESNERSEDFIYWRIKVTQANSFNTQQFLKKPGDHKIVSFLLWTQNLEKLPASWTDRKKKLKSDWQ